MQQHDSQQFVGNGSSKANLFVIQGDHKRQWYRYHALFAQICITT